MPVKDRQFRPSNNHVNGLTAGDTAVLIVIAATILALVLIIRADKERHAPQLETSQTD